MCLTDFDSDQEKKTYLFEDKNFMTTSLFAIQSLNECYIWTVDYYLIPSGSLHFIGNVIPYAP